jgi:hypothetical protein
LDRPYFELAEKNSYAQRKYFFDLTFGSGRR